MININIATEEDMDLLFRKLKMIETAKSLKRQKFYLEHLKKQDTSQLSDCQRAIHEYVISTERWAQ